MRILNRLPLHPFLFAVYPVLLLLALNADELPPSSAVRSIVLALLMATVLLVGFRFLLRDVRSAAALASLVILLFFSYGHIYALLRQAPALGALARHRVVLPLEAALVGAAIYGLVRRGPPTWITPLLNGTALAAVALALVQSTWIHAGAGPSAAPDPGPPADVALAVPDGEPPRDVYYIILDAYARADVLDEVFDFDNRPFLSSLEALGFSVADESRSNYAVTRLSIPSSLNLDYLDAVGPPLDPGAKDAAWLDKATRYSRVRSAFEGLGYQIVAIESAYGMTDWVDSDLYLSRKPVALSDARAFGTMNALEVLLTQTSMGRLVLDGRTWLNRVFRTDIKTPNEQHRLRILFAFDRLNRMPSVPGPKFVFVHLMSPHPPNVFTADGGVIGDSDIFTLAGESTLPGSASIDGYVDQVAYVNQRLLEAIEVILAESPTEPIIILQGDHGALGVSSQDRMKILNAYYLPDGGDAAIYEAISPVNSFRVVFNEYFGAEMPLLDDRSYYSPPDYPFQLNLLP